MDIETPQNPIAYFKHLAATAANGTKVTVPAESMKAFVMRFEVFEAHWKASHGSASPHQTTQKQ